ncbi:MAG: glycerate kinase [Saprospiraceae bacterium]|nr:glycerate kinase [Saprospiraceae bacterium]
MNILIAPDSFKDALSALQVCHALEAGIRSAKPKADVRLCPLADGGEGTYEALASSLGLHKVEMAACDPRFLPITAAYGRTVDGKTAFIEMAKTAGLQLLSAEERNPMLTTTFGVGQQIADALYRGVENIVLAIGGSSTNDAGIGMATALGWQFLDENGMALPPVGGNLNRIMTIVPPENRPRVSVEVICDVDNPLFGPMGAARVYARQKGADDAMILQLDDGLKHFSNIAAKTGAAPDPASSGAGAAGGMGFGAMFFLNAEIRRGIEVVLDLLDMDEKLGWADMVVTGEGKIDGQTAHGKLVQGLCRRAAKKGTPVIAFCGLLEASPEDIHQIGLAAAYSINDPAEGSDLAELIKMTEKNLEKTAERVFQTFKL